jgi:tRNA A37 methylthiotransferase MiaB
MRKQIPEDVKTARLDALQKLLLKQQYAFDDSQIGKTVPVCSRKRRGTGQIMGRTPYLQPVHVHADAALIGQWREVGSTGAPPTACMECWLERQEDSGHTWNFPTTSCCARWAGRMPSISPASNRS